MTKTRCQFSLDPTTVRSQDLLSIQPETFFLDRYGQMYMSGHGDWIVGTYDAVMDKPSGAGCPRGLLFGPDRLVGENGPYTDPLADVQRRGPFRLIKRMTFQVEEIGLPA